MNNEVVHQMMERIKDYPLEDPLGLVDIYFNKRDMVQLNQYINTHFMCIFILSLYLTHFDFKNILLFSFCVISSLGLSK